MSFISLLITSQRIHSELIWIEDFSELSYIKLYISISSWNQKIADSIGSHHFIREYTLIHINTKHCWFHLVCSIFLIYLEVNMCTLIYYHILRRHLLCISQLTMSYWSIQCHNIATWNRFFRRSTIKKTRRFHGMFNEIGFLQKQNQVEAHPPGSIVDR